MTGSKWPQVGTRTQGHCHEDKASVQGTSALPTELNGTPTVYFFNLKYFQLKKGMVAACKIRIEMFANELRDKEHAEIL